MEREEISLLGEKTLEGCLFSMPLAKYTVDEGRRIPLADANSVGGQLLWFVDRVLRHARTVE